MARVAWCGIGRQELKSSQQTATALLPQGLYNGVKTVARRAHTEVTNAVLHLSFLSFVKDFVNSCCKSGKVCADRSTESRPSLFGRCADGLMRLRPDAFAKL